MRRSSLQASVGSRTLSANEIIAADVNKLSGVTPLDASYILQKAVGLIDVPFQGAGAVWQFMPEDRGYAQIDSDLTAQDFTAILIGDVSANWTASAGAPLGGTAAEMTMAGSEVEQVPLGDSTPELHIARVESRLGEEVVVPFEIVRSGADVYSVDATLSYDPTELDLISTAAGTAGTGLSFAVNEATPGLIQIGMASGSPFALDGALLDFRFEVLGTLAASADVTFQSARLNEQADTATLEDGAVEDTTAPTVTALLPADGSVIAATSIEVDVTFSETVVGVDATDLVLSGTAGGAVGTPANQGGNTWRFPITGLAPGLLDLSLAPDAGDIEDAAGIDLANAQWSYSVGLDFGDAPSAYPTLLADNGARHFASGPTIGVNRDFESDGQPNATGTGDDDAGTPVDEDGVTFGSIRVGQLGATVTVNVQNAPSGAKLDAWIDFNDDGIWSGVSEQIADNVSVVNGDNTITFDVPSNIVSAGTYARFRLSSIGDLGPAGLAEDGEVEDYAVEILPGVIHLDATEGDDTIVVTPGEAGGLWHEVQVTTGENTQTYTYNPAAIDEIHINALGGNDRITIYGTAENEIVTLEPGSVDMVGGTYEVHGVNVEDIAVDTASGDDTVTMTGSDGSNRLYSYGDYATLSDSTKSFQYRVDGAESVVVDVPGNGRDYAYLYDTPGKDKLVADPAQATLKRRFGTAEETETAASGFQRVYVYATQGDTDEAVLTASADTRNRFYGYADYSILTESRRSFYFYARGFDTVTGNSLGDGYTYAYLHDSSGTDTLTASPTSAEMDRPAPWADTTANGFQRVYAYSTRGGDDTAELTGTTTGGNQYRGYPTYSTLTDSGRSFYHYARGFSSVTAIGSSSDTSTDRAYLYDSAGDDTFKADFRNSETNEYEGGYLTDETAGEAGTYKNWVKYFDLVYARSSDRDTEDEIDVTDEELLAYDLIRSGTW